MPNPRSPFGRVIAEVDADTYAHVMPDVKLLWPLACACCGRQVHLARQKVSYDGELHYEFRHAAKDTHGCLRAAYDALDSVPPSNLEAGDRHRKERLGFVLARNKFNALNIPANMAASAGYSFEEPLEDIVRALAPKEEFQLTMQKGRDILQQLLPMEGYDPERIVVLAGFLLGSCMKPTSVKKKNACFVCLPDGNPHFKETERDYLRLREEGAPCPAWLPTSLELNFANRNDRFEPVKSAGESIMFYGRPIKRPPYDLAQTRIPQFCNATPT